MALFEFQYRWAQLGTGDLRDKEDELEARDTALEQFISDFQCGGEPGVPDLGTFTATGNISAGGAYVSDGTFTLPSVSVADSPFPLFRAFGTFTVGGTVDLYTVVGATETLVTSLTIPAIPASVQNSDIGAFPAGTVFRFRSVGVTTDAGTPNLTIELLYMAVGATSSSQSMVPG